MVLLAVEKKSETFSFLHEPWKRFELERRTNEDGFRQYVTPEGNCYTSVTTLLATLSFAALEEWRKSIGYQEAARIGRYASTRGTNIHAYVERYLKNEPVLLDKKRPFDVSLFNGLKSTLNRINRIHLLEAPLYSDILRLAGTVDCVAEFDGVPAVIDFKTSGKRKDKYEIDSYFMQVAIYSYMVEELYKVKIGRLVILIAVEFEKPLVYIDERQNWKARVGKLLQERKV